MKKVMDSARGQGANHSDAAWHREDLQRGRRVDDALCCFEISVSAYQVRVVLEESWSDDAVRRVRSSEVDLVVEPLQDSWAHRAMQLITRTAPRDGSALGELVARQDSSIGLAAGRDVGRTRAVPGRAVAAGGVGLCAGSVVGAVLEGVGVGLRALATRGALTTRRGGRAGLALAVVQAADDQRPLDVATQEVHQHLLADARNELRAHAGAGPALQHAHPRTVVAQSTAGLEALEIKLDAHAAQAVHVQLLCAAGRGLAVRATTVAVSGPGGVLGCGWAETLSSHP